MNTYQATQALLSERAVAQMLVEQEIAVEAEAILNSLAFTTDVQSFTAMAEQTDTDAEFERLVASLVQDAGRAAESVSVAVREDVHHVRFVSLPCCSRCALLAGRVYRYSDGFLRHPNCDCFMIPTTVASPLRQSPEDLAATGQVRGLSKADTAALAAGADMGRVVNVRAKSAGLKEAGRVLARAGRPTPEGIYRLAGTDRDEAVALLAQFGYIR
ncbi:hypothetical protein [Nocardioides aurantiacus]|uniref:hypothetical protein n=1 Tax=Nocardioides aurantiacus TaxID=86796 RepID=UPI000F4A8726|nr:hypothetical protein [Nocardioides aurantiacus]